MRDVLLSIQPRWVAQIYAGNKTLELRKGLPRLPFRVFFLETGGAKLITGEAIVTDALAYAPMAGEAIPRELLEASGASEEFIRGYAGNGHLFAWHVRHVRKYARPRVWKGQSPQSYQYLGGGDA